MFNFKKNPLPVMPLRDMLFGDVSMHYWVGINCNDTPWDLFKEAKKSIESNNTAAAIATLRQITRLPGLESRQYLQAFYFLRQLTGDKEGDLKIFGVVVEIGLPEGVDTLAVYADHSARYYNYSGSVITFDQADIVLENLIDTIMMRVTGIVSKIGHWKGVRPAAPARDRARISFLTSHGLYFGEANQYALFNDVLAGKTMYAMLDVMKALINKTKAPNRLGSVV